MDDVRLIDANALQRAFDDAHKDEPDFFCCNFLNNAGNPSTEWDCVDDILENAPTIDAQPVKHGKWIVYNLYARCSECSVAYDFDTFQRLIPMNEKFPRHCSYCGADMRGDTDETK